ncbi:MAG: hypothetical protein A3G76_05405 [Acidobacteria bacterium RIFCSPLOWO2_12_FULL_65_11]|nr:MAG: hypothetical protein A3H95_17635 [Acidobacteria bacterium RIFCSPLOWO2_02_FULL_64_15]OFW33302.1 MAG: hypothetical protein A3G76_05405 [Acidobacteria bacterium RIFCSPLOWO2_12_FULL_65_11]
MVRAEGMTDKGGVRSTNEDHFAVDEQLRLCVVADGMGGHNAGEVASHLAVDAIVECVRDGRPEDWPFGFDPSLSETANLIRTAIQLANEHVLETAGTSDAYTGMGTTIVAALFSGDRVAIGHVGDSRLYRYAGGRLQRMTIDDSWVASVLAKDPHVDQAVLQHHPMRNVLTNVLGARPRTDIHVAEEQLSEGDVLLLTTDGVHGVLDDGQLERLLGEGGDPGAVAASIVVAAIGQGSRDNCTAVVAQYIPD